MIVRHVSSFREGRHAKPSVFAQFLDEVEACAKALMVMFDIEVKSTYDQQIRLYG